MAMLMRFAKALIAPIHEDGSFDKGKWISIDGTQEEFKQAIQKCFPSTDPSRLAYLSYADIPWRFATTNGPSPEFFSLRSSSMCLFDNNEHAFNTYVEHVTYEKDPLALLTGFKDSFMGVFHSKEDFAEYAVNKGLLGTCEGQVKSYISFQSVQEDIFSEDYLFIKEYVFKRVKQ